MKKRDTQTDFYRLVEFLGVDGRSNRPPEECVTVAQVTTVHRVRSLLLDAASQPGTIDVAVRRNYVSALLLLKRSSAAFDEARARVYDKELARTGDAADAVAPRTCARAGSLGGLRSQNRRA